MRNFIFALALCCATLAHADDIPAVAAVADLKFALAEIGKVFENETGRTLRLSFGSSGNFTH